MTTEIKINDNLIRITSHILFWVCHVGFNVWIWGTFGRSHEEQFYHQLIHLPEQLFFVYFTLYVLMPRYILIGKYLQSISILIITLFIGGMINWALILYVERPIFHPTEDWGVFWKPIRFFKCTTHLYPLVMVAVFVKLLKSWYIQSQNAQLLQQEKLEAELKFLKAQIHPHFLFNTLNNIYALTLKKSDYAPEMVLKLSELLDYMLYECNAPEVYIEKEIKLVKNYIDLEKLRYNQRLNVAFEIEGDLQGKKFAPMLILPFVENSFKHGVSNDDNDIWIRILIEAQEDSIEISVSNSKSSENKSDALADYKEGIGLKNVKRRLELIYPNQYELLIDDLQDIFSVKLRINIKSS